MNTENNTAAIYIKNKVLLINTDIKTFAIQANRKSGL